MKKIVIAARSSKLSLIQAEEVARPLRELGIEVEVLGIKSLGDIDKKTPLYMMREKGVFEKDVDKAVLSGSADIAVHSAKDVPATVPSALRLVAVPRRKSPYDALVARKAYKLEDLPPGSRIGTSSLRRIAMIKYSRSDLRVVPVRGNVDTRLSKLDRGEIDGLVIAEAGLERLGFPRRWERLDIVPAAGQGALAVYARSDREDIARLLKLVDDEESRLELVVEKAVLKLIGAGCRTPVGVLATHDGAYAIRVRVASVSPDYRSMVLAEARGTVKSEDDAWELAGYAAAEFARRGGIEILGLWRRVQNASGAVSL